MSDQQLDTFHTSTWLCGAKVLLIKALLTSVFQQLFLGFSAARLPPGAGALACAHRSATLMEPGLKRAAVRFASTNRALRYLLLLSFNLYRKFCVEIHAFFASCSRMSRVKLAHYGNQSTNQCTESVHATIGVSGPSAAKQTH